MPQQLVALRASVERLRRLVEPLGPDELVASAYPTEWTIADVLSHLGSGAVIATRRLDDALAGAATPAEFVQSTWDEWNAKVPTAQATDALAADRLLTERLGALSAEEQASFRMQMGPIDLDFWGYVGLRLNEHALHTWDIDVALHPDATLPPDATEVVVDNLGLIARFTAKPTGSERTIVVRTSDPTRTFTVTLTADAVTTTEGEGDGRVDLELPAEAWIRLVYGRLDRAQPSAEVDELRRVFPGP